MHGAREVLIYVQPRAAVTAVVGMHGEAVKIRVAAPPVDGEANEELIRFLAKALRLARRDITIVAGSGSRTKRVRITGATGDIRSRLLASSTA